jgi:ABC-type phosphate transport system substrate-binding protein
VVVVVATVTATIAGAVPAGAATRLVKMPPAAPIGVVATTGNASSPVSWSPVTPPAGETVTRYLAFASATFASTKHCKAAPGATSCTIPKLTNGVRYTIRVEAYAGLLASPPSSPVTSEPGLPGAPTSVRATIGNGQSTISFTGPTAPDFPVASYTVTAADATTPVNGGQSAAGATSPITVTGLTVGDSYTFTVMAVDRYGSGPASAPSPPVVPVPVPGTPTGVTAVPRYGRATVSFTPPTGLAYGFTVTATDLTTPGNGGESDSDVASPITVSGLNGGDSYTFTVTAYNGPVGGPPSAPSPAVVPETEVQLSATGSTFAAVAMEQWAGQSYLLSDFLVNWQVTTSVTGLDDFAQGDVDFAASDLPYSARQSTYYPTQPYQYLPDVGAGLGLMFNLTGTDGQRITDLNLTPSLIGKIFLGEIARWNDPAVVAANPALASLLPGTPVIPVYRNDASGENYLLTDYLLHLDTVDITAAQTAFEAGVPGQPSATWPVPAAAASYSPTTYPGWTAGYPVGQYGSDNAANFVSALSSQGSITYVEVPYAVEHGFPVASVANTSGADVQPTSRNVSTALQSATFNADWSQNLAGVYASPRATAYPLSSYSYLVTPCSPAQAAGQGSTCDGPGTPSPFDPAKGAALGQFVDFVACAGQQGMSVLGYAPLPPALVEADFDAIGRINGAVQPPAPTAATCANPYVDGQLTLPDG